MFGESIKMSWANIIHNKMRSFLTILGIVIGVASIIALITIVQGATNDVTSQISNLGADKITVQAPGTPLKQGINEKDLTKLSQIKNVAGVSPTIAGKSAVVYRGSVTEDVTVQGKNEVYFNREKDILQAGRVLNKLDVEGENKVCILGNDLVKKLFFGKNPLGEELLINGITYNIAGILKASSGFSLSSSNDVVIIPYTTAMRSLGIKNVSSFEVYMADSDQSDQIMNDIEGVLKEAFNYKEDSFIINNMEDILDTVSNITGMLSLMLAGIASISLLVGGIGIMNMMLVSVTERTTEIGLRKALGAEPKRIQEQFLIEAIFLSSFGGLAGLILGIGIALIASVLMGFTMTISAATILLAVGFSTGVGIIFGIAPARKASGLNPIDALRSV